MLTACSMSGTPLITGAPTDAADETKPDVRARAHDSGLLRPVKELPVKPYYLTFVKSTDSEPGVRPLLVGRKQTWGDLKVVKFMLGRPAKDLIADRIICLPLNEGEKHPNLKRSMGVAWENGAIPAFYERLPHSEDIDCVCDGRLELPADPDTVGKELWQKLLSSCPEGPKSALASFAKEMGSLCQVEAKERVQARIYVLRFRTGGQEIVHPAVVIQALDS
jgi:hypothetical protein